MTQDYIKVIDDPSLVRDPYSKAVLNINNTALNEHRKKRRFAAALEEKSNKLEVKVQQLECQLDEIKELIIKILEK